MYNVLENTVVIGLFILIIIIPIIVINKKAKKKRQERIANLLKAFTESAGLSISKSDSFNDKMLALDPAKKQLLDVNTQSNEIINIDLSIVSECAFIKDADKDVIKSIQLILETGKTGSKRIIIDFYKQYKDNEMKVKSLEKLAISWKKEIDNLIVSS